MEDPDPLERESSEVETASMSGEEDSLPEKINPEAADLSSGLESSEEALWVDKDTDRLAFKGTLNLKIKFSQMKEH